MTKFDEAYNIVSKINFKQLTAGVQLPASFDDNITTKIFTWTFSDVATSAVELKDYNGVKMLNFKTANSKFWNTNGVLNNISSNIKINNLQVEMDIIVPSFKTNNIFFNIAPSSGTYFYFNIKNDRLEITSNNKSVVCMFQFEVNKKYNIVLTKYENTYSFIIDGIIVGKMTSLEFTNNINLANLTQVTFGASTQSFTNSINEYVGEMGNINMSYGLFVKYNKSFTKYGENLLSRYNFDHLAITPSTSLYPCEVESVYNPNFNWTLSQPNFTFDSGWNKNNNTSYSSNINDKFTITFSMKNKINHVNVNIFNLNNKYKLVYNYNENTNPDPEVIVDSFTKSALDFENGLTDKVTSTVWSKEGTSQINTVNKIYGTGSFETIAVGDSLNTTSQLLTGGSTSFNIEFYALLKENTSQDFYPLFTNSKSSANGEQMFFTDKTSMVFRHNKHSAIEGALVSVSGKTKLRYNEVNKYNVSYDGAALRLFVNDKLEVVYGTTNGWYPQPNPYYLMKSFVVGYPGSLVSTKGLLDNVNIFDGVAKQTRNKDSYDNFLNIELSLDGANNSTNIVDNGIDKLAWQALGQAKLSTNKNFDSFSSLYLDGTNNTFIQTVNIFDDSFMISDADYTIDLKFLYNGTISERKTLFSTRYGGNPGGTNGFCLFLQANKLEFLGWDSDALKNNYSIPFTFISNTEYKITMIRKNKYLLFYINEIFIYSIQQLQKHKTASWPLFIGSEQKENGINGNDFSRNLNGYIKDFKIYKGIAIIPKYTYKNIKLEFDNNSNDTYKHSTWIKSANATYDNLIAIKGYSLKLGANDYVESAVNDCILGDNNFKISFDSNITTFLSNGELLTNENVPTNNNSYFYVSNNLNGRVFDINPGNSLWRDTQGINCLSNVWYNDSIIKKNKNVYIRRNDVILSSISIDETMTHDIKNAMRIGKPSDTFGTSFTGINGNIDEFEIINDEKLKNGVTIYSSANVIQNTMNDILMTRYNGTVSSSMTNTVVLDECPILDNFIVEADIFIKTANNASNTGSIIFRTTDFSFNDASKMGYSAFISNNNISFGRGTNNSSGAWTSLATKVIDSKFINDEWHKLKVIVNGTNFKIYLDNELQHDINDSTYTAPSKLAWYTSLDTSIVNPTSAIRSIKVSSLDEIEIFYKDWMSSINDIIDKPAIHFPFEKSKINTGYSVIDTVTLSGSNQFQTFNSKKWIYFNETNKLNFRGLNIFKLSRNIDFYIEFDFVPTLETSNGVLLANSVTNTTNLYAILHGANDGSEVSSKVYLYFNNYKTAGGLNLKSSNNINWNGENNLIVKRKGNIVSIILNGIVTSYEYNDIIDFQDGDGTRIGHGVYYSNNTLNFKGYMKDFIYFVGTSERPQSYNSKAVIDLDFKSTGKSYLFKDNFNQCIVHPNKITQREYDNSMYGAYFNGVDQNISFGKNSLFNFGLDDYIVQFKFMITEYTTNWRTLLGSNVVAASASINNPYTYICIAPDSATVYKNRVILSTSPTGGQFSVMSGVIPLNTLINLKIIVKDSVPTIYVNDVIQTTVLENSTSFREYNFNASDNTYIGRSDNDTNKMKGTIYKFKVYRNTSDISLLDDQNKDFSEKFTLTNGVDIVDAEFTEIKSHDIQVVSDINKVTAKIDDQVLEVSKNSTVDNIIMFDQYNGYNKDIRVYDTPFYDKDVFLGSELIDPAYPEIDYFDDGEEMQGLMTQDVGNYTLKGFIEGYIDRPFRIYNKIDQFEIMSGIEDYLYYGLDINYIENYVIIDKITKQQWPVNTSEMIKGYISGTIDLVKCAIESTAMKVYCYRSDTFRLIGIYDVDTDGTYNIPNLDVNSRYDIIFRDETRTIKDQISNYRKPKSY